MVCMINESIYFGSYPAIIQNQFIPVLATLGNELEVESRETCCFYFFKDFFLEVLPILSVCFLGVHGKNVSAISNNS